jgi:hypothetical protein
MNTKLILLILISPLTTFGQTLFFPTIGDGACSPEANHGFLRGVPLEVNLDTFDSLYSDNGKISPVTNQFHNFIIYPESLGPLNVTLVSKGEKYESGILIIKEPWLKLHVDQLNDSIIVTLLDEKGKNVSNNFYSAIEVSMKNDNTNFGIMLNSRDLNRKLDVHRFTKLQKDSNKTFELIFSAIAVFDKKTCLYVGKYEDEIKLKTNANTK